MKIWLAIAPIIIFLLTALGGVVYLIVSQWTPALGVGAALYFAFAAWFAWGVKTLRDAA